MDTKLKNRLLFVGVLFLFTFGINGGLIFWNQGGYYLKDYYKSEAFLNTLNRYIDYLSVYELNQTTEEEALEKLSVSDEEVKTYIDTHQISSEQGKLSEAAINAIKEKLLKTKQQNIEQYFDNKRKQKPYYERSESSFQYALKDIKTGTLYTDTTMSQSDSINDYLKKHKLAFVRQYPSAYGEYLSSRELDDSVDGMNQYDGTYTGFIGVPQHLPKDSLVYTDYKTYKHKQVLFSVFIGSAVIALLISLFLMFRTRILQKIINVKWQTAYKRLPMDVSLFFLVIIGCFTFSTLDHFYVSLHLTLYSIVSYLKLLIIHGFFITLTLVQAILLWKRLKEVKEPRDQWENTLISKIINGLGEGLFFNSTGLQIFILLFIIFCTGFGVPIVFENLSYGRGPAVVLFYFFLFMFITFPALVILIKRLAFFNRITKNVDNLVKGYHEPDLSEKGWAPLRALAKNINTMKHGVTASQKEQAKSERLKTELITNVSHDLRTPLTSIITYSELLHSEGITEEEREDYIEIINRKSKRLKVLIEDLFEASKMASGNIELDKKKVDIVQLLQQSLAENNETIEASSLHFRISKPEPPIYAVVDGQKLWRVFDNLIGNILKYSLENTRVYIAVKEIGSRVVISFKNVSKFELSEDIDELFERFKRGDESRHTEGSGLGLAIAKSIIDLHDGKMDMEVDGDLFKVIIELETVH